MQKSINQRNAPGGGTRSVCVCVCVCVNVYVDVKRYLCLVTLQRTPGVARRDDSRWLQIKNALITRATRRRTDKRALASTT